MISFTDPMKKVLRDIYDEEKFAIDRLRKLLKSVDVQHIFLSIVDVSGKEWQMYGVPWGMIAMNLIRDEENESEIK